MSKTNMVTIRPSGNWLLPEGTEPKTVCVELLAYPVKDESGEIVAVNLMVDQTQFREGTVFEMLKESF